MFEDRVAFHPTDFQPLWKAAKAKHQAALKAKKITLSADLGDLLKQANAQWDLLSTGRLKTFKRVKLKDAEKLETNAAKRKATAKLLIANDASNVKLMNGDLKKMVTISNAVIKAGRSYKSNIQGLGNPAEAALNDVLDQVIRNAENILDNTHKIQAGMKVKTANPHRYDHLA